MMFRKRRRRRRRRKYIHLRAENQDPQIKKGPQLLGFNLNNDQKLATVGLLGGRLAFRQKGFSSVCYVCS
jgi:hypothetical protein